MPLSSIASWPLPCRQFDVMPYTPELHLVVTAAAWLVHADLYLSSLIDLRVGPPRVGLLRWMDRTAVAEWSRDFRPEPGKMYLTSDLARAYVGRRWPGVEFVLLPSFAEADDVIGLRTPALPAEPVAEGPGEVDARELFDLHPLAECGPEPADDVEPTAVVGPG